MFLCFYLSFLVSIFFYSVIYVTNFFNVKVLRILALEKNSFILERTYLWLPEAATGGVLQERCSLKFRQIHRKTTVPETLF